MPRRHGNGATRPRQRRDPEATVYRYDLAVMIGGAKAEEYSAAASGPEEAWVHADLFVEGVSYPLETEEEDPFGESFTQSWPVTPYKLRVSNNTGEKRCLVLYVDGVEAYGARFLPHSSRLLEGRQSRPGQSSSQINELLFARPRLVRRGESAAVDPKLFPELESLRLDVHEMIEGKKVKKRKRGATGGAPRRRKTALRAAATGSRRRRGYYAPDWVTATPRRGS